jgi:hypothetical protein
MKLNDCGIVFGKATFIFQISKSGEIFLLQASEFAGFDWMSPEEIKEEEERRMRKRMLDSMKSNRSTIPLVDIHGIYLRGKELEYY